ncbi:hypothetical protein Tco_1493875 [Tanacetum coccineum]
MIISNLATNSLFEENDKDAEIKSSSSFTLTSPEESEFEAYLEIDSIPPGIDLTLPSPPLEVSSSNPTSPTLTGEKVCSWKTPMFFSLVRFVWKMMTRIAIRKKIICLLATYLHQKPKLLSRPQEVEEIKEKEDEVSMFTLEENLKENISSGTLLVFKEPSFLLPPPEPPDKCLNFEPILVMKNVVLNEAFYQSNVEDVNSFTIIIWIFLPYFPYTKESPLIFSFRSENFVFDTGIVTFHKPVD